MGRYGSVRPLKASPVECDTHIYLLILVLVQDHCRHLLCDFFFILFFSKSFSFTVDVVMTKKQR